MSAPLTVLQPVSAVRSPPAALPLDPRTYDRALACVHCGLCLPACPTYLVTGHEADSPRGRIQLMRGLADGVIAPTATVREHLDLCLDCRGCETACPSGVVYHELIEETRARFADQEARREREEGVRPPATARLLRWIFFHLFTRPVRLKMALLPARVMQKVGLYGLLRKAGVFRLLPASLRKMEQMLPADGPLWPRKLPAVTSSGPGGVAVPAMIELNHGRDAHATVRVGFFAGCVGSVMFDRVNRQAVDLLAACGAEVIAPRGQGCCGAIHHHNGAVATAEGMARRVIDTFLPKDPADGPVVDFITTTIAGCGAMLHEYDVLLRDDPEYAGRAREFVGRVRDVSDVLVSLGLPGRKDLLRHSVEQTVTYHDACHLAHAQKVTAAPRQLLAAVPGLRLVALPESDLCCGAAGTYNLTQPEMSATLAGRKLDRIASTRAAVCATGNVGCAMQISSEAAGRGQALKVLHPVELLHEAVFGQ